MASKRDVGVVLSGGGVNGVLMELGFLQRLRRSPLWDRTAVIFGTSSGALAGAMAALDRLDALARFLLELQPEQTFRPNRLYRLPFLGLHDFVLPQTMAAFFGDLEQVAADLAHASVELVVVATDLTDDHDDPSGEYELVYSSRTTPPAILAQAVVASAAVSALVSPLRVGGRIATDGAWVRNYPLTHAYAHPDVELIVGFRYLPRYPRLGIEALGTLRRRLGWLRKVPPVRAFLAELDAADERQARNEPAHMAETIARLARVAILRNTKLEERAAAEKDQSLRELAALRKDVLGLVEDAGVRDAIGERFAAAGFPFGGDRIIPRITVAGNVEGVGLDPGFRNQPHWEEHDKRLLIRRGFELADESFAQLGL